MHSSLSTGYKRMPAPSDAFELCHRQDRTTKLMASTQHPVSTRPEPPGATGYGPRAQCREPGLVTRPALFRVWHATSGYNDTRLTTEGRKTVDPKSVINPHVHVFQVPHNIQPQCTLFSTHTPINHEPARLDDTDTHNTRTQAPSKRSGSDGIHHASIAACARTQDPLLNTTSLTRTQTPAVVRIRTTLHSSSQVLKPLAISNAASQLAKHKQVYKWAAERVLNHTDLSWSRSKMPTLASLQDVQHLIPHQVRDAALANFTAGTVLESAKGGPLILGYDCDDMPTLDALPEFFATQGLPAALTESTRRDYNIDWRGWVTCCVVMRKPEAMLPADKQVLMAFMSQLILCQYATGTIGKFLSCIFTRYR